jgi:hypothetical protein
VNVQAFLIFCTQFLPNHHRQKQQQQQQQQQQQRQQPRHPLRHLT